MSDNHCPSEDELVSFADAELSPERLRRVEKHLELCGACAKQVMALHELIGDVAAPLRAPQLDTAAHVAAVMARLDAKPRAARASRWAVWGGALAATAAAAALLLARGTPPDAPRGHLAARGANAAPSLSRDVGLQLYTQAPALQPLGAGSRVRAGSVLTAGLRNLSGERAYLLLFGVDAQHAVHWIAPEFTLPGSDPEATSIAPSLSEQLLPSAAAFDDLAPGPLRIVALISREPRRVSEIEGLSAEELGAEGLMRRFPRAEVRQFMLEVSAE